MREEFVMRKRVRVASLVAAGCLTMLAGEVPAASSVATVTSTPSGRARAVVSEGRIAVNQQGGAFPTGLYTMNADGTGLVKVFAYAAPNGGGPPSWSPDGSMISFEMNGIAVINADGTGLRQVTSEPADRHPAWSPDGAKIAFMSDRVTPGYGDVYVVDAGGGEVTNLTNTPDISEVAPEWSPNGTQIAFNATAPNGDTDVWIMDADGSNSRDLTPNTPRSAQQRPSWSPDGQSIAFDSFGATYSIYTMNLDGSGLTRQGRGYNPNWSPDGLYLVYAAWNGGPSHLNVLEVASGVRYPIGRTYDGNLYSDW
jgi:Tol biopolymer transport system component